jgi:hypothetical protein
VLTDLVRSLVRTMEEQKEEHINQIETLIKQLKCSRHKSQRCQKIKTQLSNIQLPPSASTSYTEVARTPPSNIRTLTSIGTIPSTMTNKLYCTIDTSRVAEEEKSKAHLGAVRKVIEEEIRTVEAHTNWRYARVIRDSRNTERIRVACRDEAELQRVKEAAQKTAAALDCCETNYTRQGEQCQSYGYS